MYRILILLLLFPVGNSIAQDTTNKQPLTLKGAVATAVKNYGIIKAKSNYANAAEARVQQAQAEYLPNVNIAARRHTER